MLLGPLSETISSVSWRDCALAGDQIAGAEHGAAGGERGHRFQKVTTLHGGLPGFLTAGLESPSANFVPALELTPSDLCNSMKARCNFAVAQGGIEAQHRAGPHRAAQSIGSDYDNGGLDFAP